MERTDFLFRRLSIICIVWNYLRLLEVSGWPCGEPDIPSRRKVSARKSAGYVSNAYEEFDGAGAERKGIGSTGAT
jgi:hypothetical protein